MGLLDKAKNLVEEHKDQIQQGITKVTDAVNKTAGGHAPGGQPVTPTAQADDNADVAGGDTATEAQASQEPLES